ncbi:MAG: hypothetical protein VKL39_24365, partial [Leptolyngbyaceae bacterium]|nr:hypothetical protein [Leptolyngbyaceae bacterium]
MPAALADFDDEVFNGGPEAMMERQQGGTAIWQFVARPQRLDAMAWMAMHGNVRVLFECDDNYTLMPPDLPEPYKRKDFIKGMPAWDDQRSSVEVAKMAATNADGIITSTRFLAKRYQRLTCPYTFYCPNCVDLTMGEWPSADDHHK